MSDRQRLHGDLVRQQQGAIDAGSKASSREQDASNPMMQPKIQAAAGDLRPVDRMAGRAAASLLGAGSGPGVAAGFPAAVIANPFTSMPIGPFAPGSILDAIEEERYRNWAGASANRLASGARRTRRRRAMARGS